MVENSCCVVVTLEGQSRVAQLARPALDAGL
jgi:hypothetical protein